VIQLDGMTSRPAYPTDLSDARWALIEPVLSSWRAARAQAGLGLSEPVHDLREIVNAILYVNRAGCAWQMLPHDFPPYKTVLTITPSGRRMAPPRRFMTCCAPGCASRPGAPPADSGDH
jgi:transposase